MAETLVVWLRERTIGLHPLDARMLDRAADEIARLTALLAAAPREQGEPEVSGNAEADRAVRQKYSRQYHCACCPTRAAPAAVNARLADRLESLARHIRAGAALDPEDATDADAAARLLRGLDA